MLLYYSHQLIFQFTDQHEIVVGGWTYNFVWIPLTVIGLMYPIPSTQTTPFWTSRQTSRDSVIRVPIPGADGVYRDDYHIAGSDGADVGSIGYG